MKEELEKLERKLKRLKIKKIPTTFLSIINKKLDEVIISKYVAYLINPEYTTISILEEILNVTQSKKDEINFSELLNSENTIYEDICVEESITSTSQLDILIKFSTFWIVIENKINSLENNNQSLKYERDLRMQTELPIKYICLKPQYNKCKLQNEKFTYILYNQLLDILKKVTKYELADENNYIYIENFIKHVEGFLMNENEIQISEDLELYIDNKEIIDNMLNNYKAQCEIVRKKLEECVKRKFSNEYEIYCSKNGYLQIWKKSWNNQNHGGIHYEILCDFNHIISYDTKVKFAIHNEGKTNKIYPQIIHRTVKELPYRFDNANEIENSINKIVDEIYNVAEENNLLIETVLTGGVKL